MAHFIFQLLLSHLHDAVAAVAVSLASIVTFMTIFCCYSSTSSSLLFGVCALLIMLWLKRSSVLLFINAKGEINGRREKNVHLYDCFRLKTHEFESMEYSNDD